MLYTEYLDCAKKHLLGCTSMLLAYNSTQQDEGNVWLELYYLAGYIIEAVTVYSTYKLLGWQDTVKIEQYDRVFTQKHGIDFYGKNRKDGLTYPLKNSNVLGISHHQFGDIIDKFLRPNPAFNDTPYIGGGQIDSDVYSLINTWKTEIRYYTSPAQTSPALSKDLIVRLYKTCFAIVNDINSNI